MTPPATSDTTITEVQVELLRLPLPRPMLSGSAGGAGAKPVTHISMPVIFITTAGGLRGLGYAWSHMGGSQATRTVLEHDIKPMLLGQDALNHERIWKQIGKKLQAVGRRGLVVHAQAATDLALWDLKGKAAGLPLYKLLGGLRDSAPVYGSDGGWLYMSVEEMLDAFNAYLGDGMIGVKMKVGHDDVRTDIDRVTAVRKALGDDVWLTVDANQMWDYPKSVKAGRAFEELGIDWLEEPLNCEDIAGHARLAAVLDIPIAVGETLGSRYEFAAYLNAGAVDILQPDIIRMGGITEMLRVATLAEVAGRPLAPHHMMESTIHVACGVMHDAPIEHMPWMEAAFTEKANIKNGAMTPPQGPGLGLEIDDDTVAKYRVE
jgi:L-alanine-DL-glutamate epimerase-like enolase superfamily enzyme